MSRTMPPTLRAQLSGVTSIPPGVGPPGASLLLQRDESTVPTVPTVALGCGTSSPVACAKKEASAPSQQTASRLCGHSNQEDE